MTIKPEFLPGCNSPATLDDYVMAYDHVTKIARTVYNYQSQVVLLQFSARKQCFVVLYGVQIWKDLTYAEASKVFGECMMHCLSCQGKIND